MADIKKTIDIIFRGTDQLSGTIDVVSGQISDLGTKIEGIATPLSEVTDTILKIDLALTALGGAGLAFAFSESSKFEDASIELQKVLGNQPGALKVAEEAAFDLSAQYGESGSSILLSTADFKQAGFTIQDSLLLTKAAMDLSIAGSLDGAEASSILISILKGFKTPASEAARLVDILNEVSNNYATDVRELGVGMAALSPIAKLMGFSFEETAGILTPVIEVFRSGDEASTALKMGLLKLIDDSKPVADALAGIGVAQRDANGDLRSGKDILFDVARAFETADENDKLFLASQLVGIRQAAKMVEVFDGLAKSTTITNIAMGAAGSASDEVAVRLKSGTVVVDKFKQGFSNLAVVVGDQFGETAKTSIDGATDVENALRQIVGDGTFAPIFAALNEFAEDIGKYLSGIALAMPEAFEKIDWSGLLDGISDLTGGLSDLFEDIDLTNPEDLAEVIQFIVDSLESLVRVTKGMVDVFKPLIIDIIESAKGFNAMNDETKETSGNILGIAKAITGLGVAMSIALVTLGQNADTIKTVFSVVINSVKFMWDSTVLTVEGILLFTAEAVQDLLKVLRGVSFGDLAKALDEASSEVQIFQDSLKEDIGKRAQSNLDILAGAFGETTKAIKETSKAIEEIPDEVDSEIVIAANLAELEAELDKAGVLIREQDSTVVIDADTTQATESIAVVAEEIPNVLLEVKLQGDIDKEIERIKATADLAQTSVEWTAKLNIAEAKSNAKVLESIFDAMSNTITSTGNVLAGLFELLTGDNLATLTKWNIEDQIKKESKMREEAHKEIMKLNEAQREYMDAKTAALESGEGLITITADGLEPEIEAFMWKILEKIQIRATADQAEFLLGM